MRLSSGSDMKVHSNPHASIPFGSLFFELSGAFLVTLPEAISLNLQLRALYD